ncbi:pectate lyase superfamily protein-domain-containing protein [Dactylonectria macrodidyma]|uniref:Pectate lyase superfamily protein-domain-containing protein n=1 Tax=Dactylonectria macrodidyma TaxID=307937 RepID=A0A9P9ILF9_9HYPO|nr:pectate lyase superfamily protein-domain-containing protein [Dactylonectria macrodidyma]
MNSSSTDANDLVKLAIEAVAELNKERFQNPKFNKQQFKEVGSEPKLAPPLELNSTDGTLRRRSQDDGGNGYVVPEEVLDAARSVAESKPQIPSGNHSEIASAMRLKYTLDNNDTNVPVALKTPEGRLSVFGEDQKPLKRATAYWMTDLPQRGASPLAPAGYKVWRNVKDYGAKGDGKTDDTKAINLAISEGGRCGPNCGSSTIHPAVVFFPPGTYLVSSSIIQYYNTQILGDPHDVPTLLAASSFVGQGVITSDVYISDAEEWYVNTNNFLRSVRNFKIDIRLASPSSYMCGIHWQVAQATSLENIEFYMRLESDSSGNNQQGIYMENGSGGFLSDLTFVGGHIGAYFGNQQFTTSHLVFVNAVIAVQIHWDWAWTMHDFVIESCGSGIVIVDGAGGPGSTGQGVGSLILADSIIANTPTGISTSLLAENSTSFLAQNVGFFNVKNAIVDSIKKKSLLAGGAQVVVDSWGFGMMNNATGGLTKFVNGAKIPAMKRNETLLGAAYDKMAPNLFSRRRPKYYGIAAKKIMDVKALGAKGDGVTDDTAAINSILEGGANTSSIVYFPFGIYLVTDTIRIPVGSRVIGQAWSQIMGSGAKFQDELHPRAVVQVGRNRKGEEGIVEIQDMMFTVKGPTAGAVVLEWNARGSEKGSAGIWDSHIRVGGAKGSDLTVENCPKKTGKVNAKCKASSLMMHMTPKSSAYLENVWIWTADHDMDKVTQDQIDVYTGRGLLIESETAWLWGTSVEHAVLYQYQLSNAKNILMGMIQTESPYFQPVPKAPQPFKTGLFANDPTFSQCTGTSCAFSWAVRIVDSNAVYVLGAGLYSWFSDYSQTCVKAGNCQARGFEVEESHDVWIYNLCTKAILEMISPLGSTPTYAKDNMNGFLASILAWLQGADQTSGKRVFEGYQVWTDEELDELDLDLPDSCVSALTERIKCDKLTMDFMTAGMRGSLGEKNITDSVCDKGCGESLKTYFDVVSVACDGYRVEDAIPTLAGGSIWAGYNETCLKDTKSGKYCHEIIDAFTDVASIEKMPKAELCSSCWVEHFAIMQRSAYSSYDEFIETQLKYTYKTCGLTGNTTAPGVPIDAPTESDFCLSGNMYTTTAKDTCDSIALAKSISSAALYLGNPIIGNCSDIEQGTKLCLPLACAETWTVKAGDTCSSIQKATRNFKLPRGGVQDYNPWINVDCTNLQTASNAAFGHVICLAPQNGQYKMAEDAYQGSTTPKANNGYTRYTTPIPDGAKLAKGTTIHCGIWHLAKTGDTCATMAYESGTTLDIFLSVNPSLGTTIEGCNSLVKAGSTYCAVPFIAWMMLTDDDY